MRPALRPARPGLGHGGFGLATAPSALRLVGARQVAQHARGAPRRRPGAARSAAGLAPGPSRPGALRRPPGFAHGGGQLQLRGALAAVQRLQFRVGSAALRARSPAATAAGPGPLRLLRLPWLLPGRSVWWIAPAPRPRLSRLSPRCGGLRGLAPQGRRLRFWLALLVPAQTGLSVRAPAGVEV